MITGAVKKERNPAWKGGTTPERQSAYHQGVGKELIKAVYARDNYHCARCGKPKVEQKGLHAHHLKPWALCEEGRMDLDNFVTLCRECHVWVHSKDNIGGDYIVI